jgi:hypothetical protein
MRARDKRLRSTPMNLYSASVALLWTTAMRATAAPVGHPRIATARRQNTRTRDEYRGRPSSTPRQ